MSDVNGRRAMGWLKDYPDFRDYAPAHAAVGLIECCERKAFGGHVDASRLFLYKVTRDLMRTTGDTGAYLRTTMEALALFGAMDGNGCLRTRRVAVGGW